MTTNTEKKLLKIIKTYEGRAVEDFLESDISELIGIDIWKIDGQAPEYGEENEPDYRTIKYIQIRNVMGYIIADIATVEGN